MAKDVIKYDGNEYQLSTVNLDGLLETMIFPIKNGIVSGSEVYCFRTVDAGKSIEKHGDIFYHPEKYVSKTAITHYLRTKEELYGASDDEKIVERRVARDILNMIERVCFSEEYRDYRHRYGTKGEHDLIIQMIKERYGVE